MKISNLLFVACFYLFLLPSDLNAQNGLYFDGQNDYVSFGTATALGSSQFTLEIWFKREGVGVPVQTDADGVNAIPLITKGRAESEGTTQDMNYFLGIDFQTNTLCADFEEGSGQANPGKNHPLTGITPVCDFRWYHAAVTFDGATFKLYLNGILENSISVNALPQSSSIQYAGLATALNSAGLAAGYFNGRLDEARIWNYARTATQISNNLNIEISSASGLSGQWGLNEGSGTICANTGSAGSLNGTLLNGPLWVKGTPFSIPSTANNFALSLEGINSYISFGNNTNLGLNQFSLETWFMRKGTGSPSTSGSGGVVAIPLIAKGRGESDGNNRDMNYFLGIDTATGYLVADFEEGAGQRNPGRNHPILGATAIQYNTWYHAAVTYDGGTWNLYLNGNLENQLFVGQLPQSQSIQYASIGSALNSVGTPEGYFEGMIDEARIWNYARSQNEIRAKMNVSIGTAQSGLIGRWGMNQACGTAVADSSGNGIHSVVLNMNWYWSGGAPFNLPVPMDPPQTNTPSDQQSNVYLNSNLSVSVNDPEGKNLTITYYVQPCPEPAPSDFTVVGLPDTQHYVSYLLGGTNEMLKAQTNWITQNRIAENIVFVQGLGDCVENGDNNGDNVEWERFDTAMRIMENPATTQLVHGVPYGLCVGNHDQTPNGDVAGTTQFFNSYFGASRFNGRNYYGGHYGSNNNNNYSLFSAGSLDFIVINLEFNLNTIDPAVAEWLKNLLSTYSDRYAIIGSHYMLNGDGTFAPQGLAIYNVIKRYPNVILTQSGHVSAESRREDIYDNKRIISIMADYQSRSFGGNGLMRLLKFSPANNTLTVQTYSPWVNQFETDSNSQFTYQLNMNPVSGYSILGTHTNVPSGSTDSIGLDALLPNTCYFWYVTVSNGTSTVKSSVRKFTTVPECTVIETISPANGSVGDTVQVTGKNFNLLSEVSFNGTPAVYILLNDSVIRTIVPNGATNGKIIVHGSCTDSSSVDFILQQCGNLPLVYSITGGGTYCTSSPTGKPVGLSSSESNVSYQLYCNGNPSGPSVSGDGNPISFGNRNTIGQYTVIASNANNCTLSMQGQVSINIAPDPVISLFIINPITCFGGTARVYLQGSGGTAPYQNSGTYMLPAGTHALTVIDANGCSASGQFSIQQPGKVEGSIIAQNASCGNSNGSATVLPAGGTAPYTFLWSNGQTTATASGLAGGNYSVIITDSAGCSGVLNTTIATSGNPPSPAGMISGADVVCKNSTTTYSIAPVAGASTYTWTLPPGATGSSTGNSITVNYSTAFNGGFICVQAENACGSGASSCINVSVLTSRPAAPTLINGSPNACPMNTYTYSVSPVSNATSYTWTLSGAGATLVSGQGTNSVSVSIAAGFSKGKLGVYASNCIGNSNLITMDLVGIPIHSNALRGPTNVCAGTTGVNYSINAVPGASSYLWFILSGDMQIDSQNGTSVIISTGAGFSTGVLAVATFNTCGSYSKSYTIRSAPSQPGGISGLSSGLCNASNISYSISPVSGASSYTWTVPSGVQILSNNLTALSVDFTGSFSGSGNVCVSANNTCGASAARCLPVKSTLAPPSSISGPASVCKSGTGILYSIQPVSGALSYLWNLSGGGFLVPQGTGTSALADFSWAYTSQAFVSVSCENACGYGSGVSKNISVNLSCKKKTASIYEMNVSPNPGTGIFNLSVYIPESGYCRISLQDITGKELFFRTEFFEAGENSTELRLEYLSKGIYYLKFQNREQEALVSRIIIN